MRWRRDGSRTRLIVLKCESRGNHRAGFRVRFAEAASPLFSSPLDNIICWAKVELDELYNILAEPGIRLLTIPGGFQLQGHQRPEQQILRYFGNKEIPCLMQHKS
jgi:hypothetical protein